MGPSYPEVSLRWTDPTRSEGQFPVPRILVRPSSGDLTSRPILQDASCVRIASHLYRADVGATSGNMLLVPEIRHTRSGKTGKFPSRAKAQVSPSHSQDLPRL
jgi:hypothetical protein